MGIGWPMAMMARGVTKKYWVLTGKPALYVYAHQRLIPLKTTGTSISYT